ncbi:MAG: hypothetical protein JXC32_05360, partial [Anaerolineae bacterium]|nr:hypothetical protein [Anaerolineae bacterium]
MRKWHVYIRCLWGILGALVLLHLTATWVAAQSPGPCLPWIPVNAPAFGLGEGASSLYVSEDATEVVVFHDRLYLGMEADDVLGARLWRTKPGVRDPSAQEDWEEVAALNGLPFGDARAQGGLWLADRVDSLAVFDDTLY